MKKNLLFLISLSLFVAACGDNAETVQLKKENALLVEQVKALKEGGSAKTPKYFLKLRLKQSHISLSICLVFKAKYNWMR